MSTYDSNSTGSAAERTVALFLEYPGSGVAVSFLGDKFELVDLLAQINDSERPLPFFIQVKGTILGPTGSGASARLSVKLSAVDHIRLAKYPGPTYFAGVDESGGPLSSGVVPKVYLKVIRGTPSQGFGSIRANPKMELNHKTIELLKNELRLFYNSTDPNIKNNYRSNFDDNETPE